MKTIRFFGIIAIVSLIATSCVENSAKYKALLAQRDSLQVQKQVLDSNYNQTLAILNDVETGFSAINQNERELQVNMKGVENLSSKREMIVSQMKAIKESMDKNKAKIEELRRLAGKRGVENKKLTETIIRLQAELDQKATQIQSLQAELEQKNIKIGELTTTVNQQSQNIAQQQSTINQQQTTIKGQDTDLNTVWYYVATFKQLKETKVLTNTGLFQSRKLMAADFDKSAFTKADLRTLTSIPTDSRNIKILSSHPQDSYTLDKGTDNKITIKITNPSRFWSVSKYLVVQK